MTELAEAEATGPPLTPASRLPGAAGIRSGSWPQQMTSPGPADQEAIQRTRFQMIEAEIPSADDAALAALALEVGTMTRLPQVERSWMLDQIDAETRRRTG